MMEKECPYCGRYVYCNNAEGCPCADYEKWLENEEKKQKRAYLTTDQAILLALDHGKVVVAIDSDELVCFGRFVKFGGVICRIDRDGDITEINASIKHMGGKYYEEDKKWQ